MLIQILIGVTIIITLSSIAATSLSSFLKQQALENDTEEVVALFTEARNRTLAAEGGTTFGVHLAEDKVVLFSGETYTPGDSGQKTILLNPSIMIESIALEGAGADVAFIQSTGGTDDYGTFVVRKRGTADGARTVTISQAGQVSN